MGVSWGYFFLMQCNFQMSFCCGQMQFYVPVGHLLPNLKPISRTMRLHLQKCNAAVYIRNPAVALKQRQWGMRY